MAYVSKAVEGGIVPLDLLDQMAIGDVEGQRETDLDCQRSWATRMPTPPASAAVTLKRASRPAAGEAAPS